MFYHVQSCSALFQILYMKLSNCLVSLAIKYYSFLICNFL